MVATYYKRQFIRASSEKKRLPFSGPTKGAFGGTALIIAYSIQDVLSPLWSPVNLFWLHSLIFLDNLVANIHLHFAILNIFMGFLLHPFGCQMAVFHIIELQDQFSERNDKAWKSVYNVMSQQYSKYIAGGCWGYRTGQLKQFCFE